MIRTALGGGAGYSQPAKNVATAKPAAKLEKTEILVFITQPFRSKAILRNPEPLSFVHGSPGKNRTVFFEKINALSTSEEPQNGCQNQAGKDAGDYWEVQAKVS